MKSISSWIYNDHCVKSYSKHDIMRKFCVHQWQALASNNFNIKPSEVEMEQGDVF